MGMGWLAFLSDWTWRAWIGGGTLILAGFILAVWAIRGDRSKGRRRCPKCWYDLRGTPGLCCSECGHTAKTEKRLHKTRRRWRWAGIAAGVQFAGVAACLAPKVQRDGWASLLHTWGLLLLAPEEARELRWKQMPADPSMQGQVRFVAVTDPIVAELARRQAGNSLSDWQWKYVLEHKNVIRTRKRWPETVPLAVCMRCPGWLEGCTIQVRATRPNDQMLPIGRLNPRATVSHDDIDISVSEPRVIGPVTGSTKGVVLDCIVERREDVVVNGFGSFKTRELWRGLVNLSVELVKRVDDAIIPQDDSELTDAVRGALELSAADFPTECSYPCQNTELLVRLDRTKSPRLADIAFGFAVEVLCEDRVVQTLRLGPSWDSTPEPRNSDLVAFERAGDFPHERGFAMWSLRVRGDGEMALYDWDKPKYWAGEFTLPLSEVLKQD